MSDTIASCFDHLREQPDIPISGVRRVRRVRNIDLVENSADLGRTSAFRKSHTPEIGCETDHPNRVRQNVISYQPVRSLPHALTHLTSVSTAYRDALRTLVDRPNAPGLCAACGTTGDNQTVHLIVPPSRSHVRAHASCLADLRSRFG